MKKIAKFAMKSQKHSGAMKEFTYDVTVHPRYDDEGKPNGGYSILFTPSVIDTVKESVAEDILLVQIDKRTFLNITTTPSASEDTIKIARDFDDMMTIYSMSEQDIEELAYCIRIAALKCAATIKD